MDCVGPFYHGTRADLRPGDLIVPGYTSNFGERRKANHVYFSNLTDKKFPGNPTRSYRSREALRVVGEVKDWVGHAPEALQAMRDGLARLREQGLDVIDD